MGGPGVPRPGAPVPASGNALCRARFCPLCWGGPRRRAPRVHGGGSCRKPPSSSGLGHRPFKAAARVRIPLGVLLAHASGARSCRAAWSARHPVKVEVAGSNPVGTAQARGRQRPGTVRKLSWYERPPEKRKVGGSTPPLTTPRKQAKRPDHDHGSGVLTTTLTTTARPGTCPFAAERSQPKIRRRSTLVTTY